MSARRLLRRLSLAALALLALAVVALNWTYGRLPAEPKPHGTFARVAGLRIRYLERPGRGTAVVLLHGLPGTAEDFDAVTPLLTGERTIALDRPGYGYSTGGYVPFGRQLEVIHALLVSLHVVRPVLVGHSYGGTLALAYAERYPNEVAGLVLVDAAAEGTHPSAFERLQDHVIRLLQLPVVRQLANLTFSQLLRTIAVEHGDSEAFAPQPVAAAHRRRLLAINMTYGNLEALVGEQLAAAGTIRGIDRHIRALRMPAVVVQGDADRLVKPRYGRRLAADLPNARLVMVSGGHMVPYTHPAVVAAAVQRLVSRTR